MSTPATDEEVEAPSVGPHVPDPLALASRRDEVPLAPDREQVDRSLAGLAGLPAPYLEHPAAPDAHAQPGEPCHDLVQQVHGEPARLPVGAPLVVRVHLRLLAILHGTPGAEGAGLAALDLFVIRTTAGGDSRSRKSPTPATAAGDGSRRTPRSMAEGRAPRRYSPVAVSPSEVAQLLTVLMSGMAGLVVGSFLNVVVYRLPLQMSVVQPPSHCPACATRLTVVDLVPVLSWLWLRARCRHCGTRISWRYPAVELGTGLLCAATAGALGSLWPLPPVAVIVVCALGAAIVDADGAAVPLAFVLVGALAAASLLPIAIALGHADRLAWAALGAALGAAAGAALGAVAGTVAGTAAGAAAGTGSGFVAERSDGRQRGAGIALLASLAWTAGWLWPPGGACVAGWIVLATVVARLGARPRAPFVVLVGGAVVGILASALVSRP